MSVILNYKHKIVNLFYTKSLINFDWLLRMVDMTTFTRIKKLCNERKISINELENALGYSKNTLYRLKTQTPGADKLQKIADYFNTSTDYLLGRTNNPHLDNDDEITDDDFRKIERFARNLTPNNRKKALRILEATFDDAFSKDEDDDDDDL